MSSTSVLIESVDLIVVVILSRLWRHVSLLTLRLVLRFLHFSLDLVLQELCVLLENLEAQAIQLDSLSKQFRQLCGLIFNFLVAVDDSLLDRTHFFCVQLVHFDFFVGGRVCDFLVDL